jgi:hypothetical protein
MWGHTGVEEGAGSCGKEGSPKKPENRSEKLIAEVQRARAGGWSPSAKRVVAIH